MDGRPLAKRSIKGVWLSIVQISDELLDKRVVLANLFKRLVGIGDKTYFWKDCWCGDITLKYLRQNLYGV